MTPEVIPWMSPCLSQSMSFVLAGIGHPMKFRRGDVIYTSPGLFGNLGSSSKTPVPKPN